MEIGSNSLQDLENEAVDEYVNLNDPQEEEENIMLDERGEIGDKEYSKSPQEEEENIMLDERGEIGDKEYSKSSKVGMIFSNLDEAYEFYNKYAYVNGFGITKKHTRRKDDKLFEVTFACAKGGKAKVAQDLTAKRIKMSRKTDCKARIIVRYRIDGLWHLEHHVLEHNHNCTPSKERLFRSHKNLPLAVRKQLEYNDAVMVPTCKSFQTLVERAGGYENLSYTERDCRNYLTKVGRLKLKEGDAQAIMDYFLHKNKEDLAFFYVMDLNEDGCLRNVFWADSRSRAMYSHFNDVISFDTTYLTNKHAMPFSPFVGVNHHGSSILLGAGLLCDERTDTYVWLFKAWLACMGDVAPKAIITDQCKAIGNAVANVFPNSKHRLCLWHILKKVPEKFAGHANYHNIKDRFSGVVYDSLRVCEFEEGWGALLKDYDLDNNEWLKSLFEVRHMWVPTFVKDAFWAGMSSIQRSEGMNAYFDRYVTATTSLQEFLIRYEKALKGKFEKETIEDFDARDKQPTLISSLKFEEQLSQIYTPNMFRKFQKQMQKLIDCTISLVRKDGVIKVYEVRESVKGKRCTFEVLFNESEIEVRCVCSLFEFQGILCAHAIVVLREECIEFIPPMYICNRWRKNFKHDYHTCSFPNVIPKSHKERYDNLYRHWFQWMLDMVEAGATTEEKHDLCMELLKETRVKFNESIVVTNSKVEKEGQKKKRKEYKKKDHPKACVATVSLENCITSDIPTQEIHSYSTPFVHHQYGGLMTMMPRGDLPSQVSRLPRWTINQSYPPWVYGQTSGNFTPRAEWGEGGARRD